MIYQWLPYCLITLIPGVINLIAAWQELDKRCRSLVFFKPLRSLGVYIWSLFQILAPSLLFWYAFDLTAQPPITSLLVFEALGLGVGFVALLNATTEVGTIPIKLKPIYSFFVDIAFDLIAQKQTRHTAYFWRQVEVSLNACGEEQLRMGLNYLEDYFIADIALDQEETQAYQHKLKDIRQKPSLSEKIKPLKTLLKDVRRADLAIALQEFGLNPQQVMELFKPR